MCVCVFSEIHEPERIHGLKQHIWYAYTLTHVLCHSVGWIRLIDLLTFCVLPNQTILQNNFLICIWFALYLPDDDNDDDDLAIVSIFMAIVFAVCCCCTQMIPLNNVATTKENKLECEIATWTRQTWRAIRTANKAKEWIEWKTTK